MLELLSMVLAQAAHPSPVKIPAQPELTKIISAKDSELFELFFLGCDPARLRTMLTDDIEFYHDKDGFVFDDADAMTADYAKSCEARKAPGAWRSRRELVTSTLRVDPIPGHGAIEAGEHLFYERKGDGPEKLVGRARFTMVWRLEGGQWKLSRVLSYAHAPVTQ